MVNIELKKDGQYIGIFVDGKSTEQLKRIDGIISLDLKNLTLRTSEGIEIFEGTADLALGYLDVEENEFRKAEETESIVQIQYDEDDFRDWMEKVDDGDGWCHLTVGNTAGGHRVGRVSICLKESVYKYLKKLYFGKHLDYLTIDLNFLDWLEITKDELGIYEHSTGYIVEHGMEGTQRGEVNISYGTKTYDLNMPPDGLVHKWESNPVKKIPEGTFGEGEPANYYTTFFTIMAIAGILAFLFFI